MAGTIARAPQQDRSRITRQRLLEAAVECLADHGWTGSTVAVVHGLLAGVGGTGHVHGFAEMSPAHSAGEPPTITFTCFGITTTGPAWQQVMTAELLAMGGMPFLCAEAPRSIAPALPSDNHP